MLFDRFVGLFSRDIGIDLGTANTVVYVRGHGIAFSEPSVVAVHKDTGKVLDGGVGLEAKRMLGRCPPSIQAIRPMRDGVIADFNITEAMLSYFIRKVHGRGILLAPRVVIAIPSGITEVEEEAVRNSAKRAGARSVHLIDEPRAAAMGAGLQIDESTGHMVVDIGGGTTEVAVISLADIACSESLRIAGDDLDTSIVEYMKRTYSLLVGEQSAEQIKINIGSACPLEEELEMEVGGRDLIAGLPRTTTITSQEIREALSEPIGAMIEAIKRTLERTEPELSADLVHNGITLCGGGSQLRGLPKVVSEATGLKVRVADDPMNCVARGTGIYLENLDHWRGSFELNDET
jgi:rod shape-determining protein MreB and related proteins